jgi:predicted permease
MFAESLVQDLRYALRGVRRSPLFAASVAATIGLGLGVFCSAFTIVNAYLFKAVHLPRPHELHGLTWNSATRERHEFTLAEVEAMASSNPVFSRVAAGNTVTATLPNGLSIAGHLVTADYFAVLGAPAALGRTLAAADVARPDQAGVIVLSDAAWRSHFDADAGIVGREVVLSGSRFVVLGVTRAGATLPGDEAISFWAPLAMTAAFGAPDPATDEGRSLFAVGRRRPDVPAEQVRAWFDTWVRQRFPAGSELAPMRTRADSLATRIPLTRVTLTLFGLLTTAFGLVLLIACANVTNMLLARGLSRQRELGVRISLGATRWRVVRQLMIESCVVALPATAVALLCTFATAWTFPRIVTATFPAGAEIVSQMLAPFEPDLRVVSFVMVAGFLAALFVGVSPAMQLTRASLVDAMRGQLGANARVSRVRNAFVMVQIATCVLFFVAAIALVVESRRMASSETGLDYERVLTVQAPADRRSALATELAARPDVEQVTAVWRPPLHSPMSLLRVTPAPGGIQQSAGFMVVSPEYFAAMGVQLRRGRGFSLVEAEQHAAVVIVSDATARLFWPHQDPLGQKVDILPPASSAQRQPTVSQVTVIGVAEDVVNGTLLDGIARTSVYFPTTASSPDVKQLLVRTRGDAATAAGRIRAGLHAAHPTMTFEVVPLRLHAAVQVWSFRAFSTASGIPAVIGLLLSFAGVYGVVAFVMTQRTREFGIRMALGASAGDIMRSVVGDTVRTAFIAAALGVTATVATIRGAVAALLGVTPVVDPPIYAAGVAVVVLAAAAASLVPAMRAIHLNPSIALRAE